MLGFGTGATTGTVVGGVVYTVNGAAAGSGVSRLTEKLDIHNQSGNAVTLQLAGLGFKPTQAALEVPDLSGLDLQGTTMVFFYGNAQTDSFTTPPFAPVMVLPAVSFSGFNPLFNQNLGLPAGARMTMVTELKVAPAPILLVPIWLWIVLLSVAALSVWALRRRKRPT